MRSAATATLVAAAVLLAGCGGSSNKTTTPPASTNVPATTVPSNTTPAAPLPSSVPRDTCLPVPPTLARKVEAHLVLSNGRLSHLRAVASDSVPGISFVSGVVDGGGAKHLVATWATQRLDGAAPIYAVDGNAALVSTFGGARAKDAKLHATVAPAYKSRVCAYGPGAPQGVDAPLGGGGAPATH